MKKFVKRTLAVFLSVAVVATFTPMFCFTGVMAAGEPDAPDSFYAKATNKAVTLKWSESTGADKYIVYKNGEEFKEVTGLKLTDKKVKKSKVYKYEIAAVNASGASEMSYAIKVKATKGKNPTSVKIAFDTEAVAVAGADKAKAKVSPKKAFSKKVVWESSDDAVATVDEAGIITGVAEGTANISARTVNGIVKSKTIEVVAPAAEIFIGGKIYTVEGENWDKKPEQAMAVSEEGTILAVGTDSYIKGFCNEETKITKLAGKTVMPGFIDSHDHPPGTAMTDLFEINNYYDFTIEDSLATIKKFVKEHTDMDIYWGAGFNYAMFGKDYKGESPRILLDNICADKPFVLTSNDGHSNWVNTAALVACGIDEKTEAITGGNIQREADGYPNGILTDCHALITLEKNYSHDQYIQGMEKFVEYMNEWGFTGCSTGGQTGVDYAAELDKKNALNMRMNFSSNFYPDCSVEENIANLNDKIATAKGCDDVMVKTSKYFLDGVVEGYTAYMSKPYVGAAAEAMGKDYVSEPKWIDKVAVCQNMAASAKEGSQIHIHAIGDAAIELAVDGIEYAQKEAGDKDYRNVITHLQVVQDDEKERMGKLGIIGSLQPFWHLKEPDWYEYVDEDVLGAERAWKEYPAKSLQDEGVVLTFSGDYPVSPSNNPFWAIEASVTRNLNAPEYYGVKDIKNMDDPKYLLNPEERVSIKTAIEAYTINGAYQMYEEDTCGSLKAGKVADFIVLSKDPMTTKAIKIDSTKVLKTYKDGEIVFQAK